MKQIDLVTEAERNELVWLRCENKALSTTIARLEEALDWQKETVANLDSMYSYECAQNDKRRGITGN